VNGLAILIQKESVEEFLVTRGAAFLLIGSIVLSAFSILLVSNTELSLLDDAEAVYFMGAIVLTLASLITIIRGSDGFAGERDRGTLETVMLAPVSGARLAVAKLAGILIAWIVLLVLAAPYLWVTGQTAGNFLVALIYLAITGTLLVLAFGGLSLGLSAKVKSFKAVLSIGLTIFLFLGSPVVIGPSLRQSAVGRMLDVINPFADALNILDSVVIDNQGMGFQLIRLIVMLSYALAALWFLFAASKRIEL
jgi:ABC-type transport system involved in multi-copper enzyme maturation permease subunit